MLDDELMAEIEKDLPEGVPHVFISAVSGFGITELKDLLWKAINDEANRTEPMSITHRRLDGHHRVREEDEFIFENPAMPEPTEEELAEEADWDETDWDDSDGNILAMTPKWIEPIKLDTSVRAYVTARGDVGDSPYSGFNPCHYTGDSPEHVDGCRKKLADYLGVSADAIVLPRQTHSSRCKIIERIPVVADDIYGVDAVVTRLHGVAIGVSTADCVPVLLVDSDAGVIGAVHAGWRGAAGGVVENAIAAMISIGAVPSRIKAAMGPCICVDCFEVGEEVAEQFPESYVMRDFPNRM